MIAPSTAVTLDAALRCNPSTSGSGHVIAKNMMRLHLLPLLLLLCGPLPAQECRRGIYRKVEEPIGVLGYRLGSLVTIEGLRATELKSGNQTLMVDTINGESLEEPVAIWVDHERGLPVRKRISIRGYETGKWIGTPDEVIKAYPDLGLPQGVWHFFHSFIIVEIISPKNLEDDDPNRPTL